MIAATTMKFRLVDSAMPVLATDLVDPVGIIGPVCVRRRRNQYRTDFIWYDGDKLITRIVLHKRARGLKPGKPRKWTSAT